jgi:GTP-binding protein
MIIGEHSRDGDLEVNPTKAKALSNVRTVQKDEFSRLSPPRVMSLEEHIAYVRGRKEYYIGNSVANL